MLSEIYRQRTFSMGPRGAAEAFGKDDGFSASG